MKKKLFVHIVSVICNVFDIFSGIHPRAPIRDTRRFAPLSPLVANRNVHYYRTCDIGVENEIYFAIVLEVCVITRLLGTVTM